MSTYFFSGEAAITVSELEPSWSSRWELAVLSSSSSSLEMVELQSEPTVMLDSGLSPSCWVLAVVTRLGLVPVLLETLP